MTGDQTKLIAINNVLNKGMNWAENTLFEYTMYDGDNVTTSAQFFVRKDTTDVYVSNEDSITCSAKHIFSLSLEIETMDNSGFDIVFNDKIGMTVSLVGRNLWMLYNKAPFDPEITASTGTYYQGLDYFMQPSARTIGFSVRLQF